MLGFLQGVFTIGSVQVSVGRSEMASSNSCFEGAAMLAFDRAPEKVLPPEVLRHGISKDFSEPVTARLNLPRSVRRSEAGVMKNPGIVCSLYTGIGC